MRYTESNADERQADLEEQLARAEHRLEERTQNAEFDEIDALAYWLGRVS